MCTFFIQNLKMKKLFGRILSFVGNGHWYDSGYVFIEEFFSRLICDCLTFVIVWRIFSWLICDCLTATYKTCFCFDVVLLPISFRHNDRPTDRLSTFDFQTTMTTSVGKSRLDQRCERCSLFIKSYPIMT